MQKKIGTADTKTFKAATTPGAEIEHPRVRVLPYPSPTPGSDPDLVGESMAMVH